MYKKETKKKDFERKSITEKMNLLSIVIVNTGYKKRGKFIIKTSKDTLEV
jgi:hypothetical protein